MVRVKPLKKLRLTGFNNLTKSLSFNLYDVCHAKTRAEKRAYLEYIDEEYNAGRLTGILERVTSIIGANILNVARQDYEPQGASVTMLISEDSTATDETGSSALALDGAPLHEMLDAPGFEAGIPRTVPSPEHAQGSRPENGGGGSSQSVVAHLDKSHICVHTYPEFHPDGGICTFRADLEVSTCGRVSPLHSLNYLIREFDSDVINIDYRVRGFTRDIEGRKHYIDHKISSIQQFIEKSRLRRYHAVDVNVYQENLFHTKLMWKKIDLDRYLFGGTAAKKALPKSERRRIKKRLAKEIQEIFYGRNLN